jgi:hypothetical protein
VAIYRDEPNTPPTIEQIKSLLCATVDRSVAHGDSISDYYMVMSSMDPVDPIFTAIVGNGPMSEGNARLIAAAPKLLDELKKLYRAYVLLLENGRDRIIMLGGKCDDVQTMEEGGIALRRARDVIAEAEDNA